MSKPMSLPCPFLSFPVALPACDEDWMKMAYNEALDAWRMGEVPVGAIVVEGNRIVGRAHNCVESTEDPTGHCELLAMGQAAQLLGDWRLTDCTLYVTKEPCPMCSGACVMARIGRVVFAVGDEKMGCLGGCGCDLSRMASFNHAFPCTSGVLERPCQELLRTFFQNRRRRPTDLPPQTV